MIKKIFVLILIFLMIPKDVNACNWATDIKQVDGGYLYTKNCHILVGKKLEELEKREEQVGELKKAIELKDLALRKSEERTALWMDTSYKANERLNQYEMNKSTNQWISFGLGVLTMSVAVWGASQLSRK